MTATGSCGHDVTNKGYEVSYMEFTREGERAVAFGYVCKSCLQDYEKWGIVLHNEQEESDWLSGKLERPE